MYSHVINKINILYIHYLEWYKYGFMFFFSMFYALVKQEITFTLTLIFKICVSVSLLSEKVLPQCDKTFFYSIVNIKKLFSK